MTNTTATPKTIIAAFSTATSWYTNQHGTPERILREYTLYEANFYGVGQHRYLAGDERVQLGGSHGGQVGPRYGSFDMGNADAIAAKLGRLGVEVA